MRIYIIGGGFAGVAAAKQLSKIACDSNEVFLIDKNEYTTMLPNLPELTSGRLKEYAITEKITKLIPSNIKFLKEEILELNFEHKQIKTVENQYNYDYLILAGGSKTNFYGFNRNLEKVNVLESLESAKMLKYNFMEYMKDKKEGILIVSGAGFTGIELACNLYDYCKKINKKLKVVFVEVAKKVLPMLSKKSSTHVMGKLKMLNFTILTENQITEFDGSNITLKNGEIFNNAFFCWCSGVKSSLKPIGSFGSIPDGRIIVNEVLNIPEYPEVFVSGDAAAIKDKKGMFLRRAVTFSQMSGKQAGKNLCSVIKGKEMTAFKPIDLGWIIPLYISSVGVALGVEVRGRKGIFMHYLLCGIKNYSIKNFFSEVKAAFKYPFVKL